MTRATSHPARSTAAFDTLATEMRNTAALAEDFAADAWTFAGRSNTPPVADFAEGAHTGADGLTVKFKDTSTSEDLDPLAITWDFGDGETATGTQGGTVEHTYADEGPYTVTVTATDEYGSDTKSQADLARTAQPAARRILHGDAAAGTGAARGRLRRRGIERPGRLDRRRTSGTSATPRLRPACRRRTRTRRRAPTP